MKNICPKCGIEREFITAPKRHMLHVLFQLAIVLDITEYILCEECGEEIIHNVQCVETGKHTMSLPTTLQGISVSERHSPLFSVLHGKILMTLNYPAVSLPDRAMLFPIHEGRLSSSQSINQYGDPDLMAEFSAEYLKQYWAIVPKGRLPKSMTEMMPPLFLLLNSAELILKADLIRSGKTIERKHILHNLYDNLDEEHRNEVERRFADTTPNTFLNSLGIECPSIREVLKLYKESSAYLNTRYFAEPPKFEKRWIQNAWLSKTMPYPIFLPFIVQAILDSYTFFSGTEHLMRLGGDVAYGMPDPEDSQYSGWGLVPSSIGIVVLQVYQQTGAKMNKPDPELFHRFKTTNPPGYLTTGMFGSESFLCYGAGKKHYKDGAAIIDGLECNVWFSRRLGMLPRDLYLLANKLRDQDEFPRLQVLNNSATV